MKTTPPAAYLHLVTLGVDAVRADAVSDWLSETCGLQPVQIQRPGARTVWIEIYFPDAATARTWAVRMRKRPGVHSAKAGRRAPRDWLSFWRHHFKPMNIGRRLRICPVWEKRKGSVRGRVTIWVDPGASFGTGDHFTTRFCLEMIDRVFQQARPRSMLDVGTGSGILAIAAARLGCPRVVGTEHDPLALRQAIKNVARNRVGRVVALRAEDLALSAPAGRYDMVAANLVSGLLIDHAEKLVAASGKWLMLSGIREHEADTVAETYLRLGADEVLRDGDGEWAGMLLDTTECH